MPLYVNVLSWTAIGLATAGAAAALLPIRAHRVTGQHARVTTREWRTARTCCGVILLTCSRWTQGIATWLLLAAGCWLIVVWDLASWLRTRYRLTRIG